MTFTAEDHRTIEKAYSELRDAARKRCTGAGEMELVQKAFEFANEAHKNVRRRSGEPYILHPIAVAKIVVSEIGLGCKSICAALLHDVVEDTEFTTEDIEHLFGAKIASLVDGLTKMKTALDENANETTLQAENFKRILLTLNDDVRIILIKLADRLHNIRTIEYMPEYKREKILSETMYIFVPLAHRLGLHKIKTEMENIWLQYKEPAAYREMTDRLNEFADERQRTVDDFIVPIHDIMHDLGYTDYKILKRLKSPYSIWRKMTVKHIPFEEIYDIYAIRIVFKPHTTTDERSQCNAIYNGITNLYPFKLDRYRDWVKQPKSNGYEAIHITAMAPGGLWIEVQIQTERMNNIAERGVAAHWLYKKLGGYEAGYSNEVETWLQKVRTILENPDANAIRFLDDFHKELVTADIYVFTPNGDPRTLAKGSTVLDFAYSIHTEVGAHAIAAKVNQKLVALSTELHNGDQVEIITSDAAQPKREWLEFVHSSRSRRHILDFLNEESQNAVQTGQKLLDRHLTELGISERINSIKKCLTYFKLESKDELYRRIGLGLIDLGDINRAVAGNPVRDSLTWGLKMMLRPLRAEGQVDRKKDYILEENVENGTASFARAECCAPIPGDKVTGFLGEDGIVTIHRRSCPVATNLASIKGEAIVPVKWSRDIASSFLVRISMDGIDRVGILESVSQILTVDFKVNIRKLSIESVDGVFNGTLEIYVPGKEVLERIIHRLGQIKGIERVQRTEFNAQ